VREIESESVIDYVKLRDDISVTQWCSGRPLRLAKADCIPLLWTVACRMLPLDIYKETEEMNKELNRTIVKQISKHINK
jgi:hypothetical protein